ncbi:MAG: phospholipid carrier-dependent glycosyltransferase [Pirellulales bacterium]|nr:phospholipid carrier-dependent glycosyltransferase [Pirellulales bacterium]
MAIALTAWGLGYPLVRRWAISGEDALSRQAWSFAIGLITAGTLLTGLGLIGCLDLVLIRVLTVAGCGWALGQIWRQRCRRIGTGTISLGSEIVPVSHNVAGPPNWWQQGLFLACLFALAGSMVSALSPATAGDALCYHLELPKQFLQAEAILFVPWHDNATFPLLTEIWFAWGMALEGAVTAQLIHWGLGVLFAMAVMSLARDLLGRDWAVTAGAIALLIPAVSNQMTSPLNDIALAAFTTLGLIAWRRYLLEGEPDKRTARRTWILRAGLAAGAALAIKYVALIFVVALALATAWRVLRRQVEWSTVARGAVVVFAIAFLIASAWYIRAAWHRGNPVYPFFASLAGNANGPDTIRESKRPLGWNAADLAGAPWHLTMKPDAFGGRGHQLGCLFLATLPGVLFARRLRGLGFLLIFAACYFMIWFALRQNLRFLLPAVPVLILAATWLLVETCRFAALPALITRGMIAGALALMALLPLYRARKHVAVALGVESRATFLQREEPTYLAAQFALQQLPRAACILSQDYRMYYFPCPVTRENIWRRETGYQQGLDGMEASAKLRTAGFSHVLLAESLDGETHFNATLSKLIAQAEKDAPETVTPVLEYESAAIGGHRRRYRLIELH